MQFTSRFTSPLLAELILPRINLFGQQGISGLFIVGGFVVIALLVMPITLLIINLINSKKAADDTVEII